MGRYGQEELKPQIVISFGDNIKTCILLIKLFLINFLIATNTVLHEIVHCMKYSLSEAINETLIQ